MNRSAAGRLVVGALLLVGLSVFVQRRLVVTTDITHFLPEARDRRVAELSRAMADSEMASAMVLSVEGPDRASAARGARELGESFAHDPDVLWLRRGAGEDVQRSFYDLFYPRRFALHPGALDDASLDAAARSLQQKLASPLSPVVRPLAPADPLLTFGGAIERLRSLEDGGLTLEGDQLVTADERHGVVFLATRASPFEYAVQQRFLAKVDARFAAINAGQGGALRLETSSVSRYAVAAETTIKQDIQRISVLSTVGIILLFLAAFRSLRYVLVGMIPLAFGTVSAMAAGILCFGTMHGLTLAFGSSLLGTGIDYVEHYFTQHTLAPDPDGAEAKFRKVWPGLFLGALTTIAGLSGLAWTSFPGIREIAVFSTVGVLSSLFATRWLVPQLTPDVPKRVALQHALAAALGRGLDTMEGAKKRLVILPVAAALVCLIGFPRLRWVDDVSALGSVDAAIAAEDLRVRGRITSADPGRFVLAVGDDDEQALVANDLVAERLDEAKRAGTIKGFHSLRALLTSAETQRKTWRRFVDDRTLPERLGQALDRHGFVRAAFAPFEAALREPPPEPLTFEDVRKSPLGDLVRPFRLKFGKKTAFVTSLTGVANGDALAARFADRPDVIYLDQARFLDEAYGRFRVRTYQMIGVGLFVVLGIVHARYRRVRLSLAAFLPAVLAGGTTLSAISLSGTTLNLLHLVGLLLVLSMGVDYGIFVVESRDDREHLGATLVSLVIGMITTVLSFGLLAMSSNPALRALGSTAGLGVLLSMILAPAALVLLGAAPPAAPPAPAPDEAP